MRALPLCTSNQRNPPDGGARVHESTCHRRLGLHRLPRRRPAARPGPRPRIFDVRAVAASHAAGTCDVVHRRPGRPRRVCNAAAAAATSSSTSPPPPTSTPSRARPGRRGAPQRARHAATCSRPRGAAASARRLRLDDLGLLRHAPPSATTRTRRSRLPAHLYTATKLAGELYCRSYGELYGARVARSCASASPTARARGPPR